MPRNIKITDNDNCILYEGNLYKLPVAENIIIEQSIEYFNDSEPCFLHKSAVTKKIYYEIEDFFQEKDNIGVKEIKLGEFPLILKRLLEKIGNAKSIYL
ncbi:hypothetical protein K2F40_13035 [Clostridium sp. CM028]|uniref:hypothetical protein n=1 Tax=Clostridium TaxID=1485 RepID=UPI0013EEC865|nr:MULTISPECIES: hypothetical protein [Clostridium]MBU3092388.1 hypothetical protein [Clostridium sp. CF011]MBW9146017.1 hypothetical protein [Clostridium sp. CM027]MBW9149883.1 hypothetical protein [Clostridium sp. CM028]MBZ9606698.1 hypothetical protein [Clostridium estertheticum]UVE39487.1 hypothetical protein KTC92_09495 [Clostridium sp. CM027]